MRVRYGSGLRKMAAAAAGILLLTAVLFSAFYITVELNHHCSGEDCPVCSCIQQCENTLHQLHDGTGAEISVLLPAVSFLLTGFFLYLILVQETPVSQKVRLDD